MVGKITWMLGAEKTSELSSSILSPGTSSCSTTREERREAPIAMGKWPKWFTKCIITYKLLRLTIHCVYKRHYSSEFLLQTQYFKNRAFLTIFAASLTGCKLCCRDCWADPSGTLEPRLLCHGPSFRSSSLILGSKSESGGGRGSVGLECPPIATIFNTWYTNKILLIYQLLCGYLIITMIFYLRYRKSLNANSKSHK